MQLLSFHVSLGPQAELPGNKAPALQKRPVPSPARRAVTAVTATSPPLKSPDQKKQRVEPEEEVPPTPAAATTPQNSVYGDAMSQASDEHSPIKPESLKETFDAVADVEKTPVSKDSPLSQLLVSCMHTVWSKY